MADEDDRTRTAVKTYVPQYQKSEWKAHADSLEMSQAEFIRTMVQAGRNGFKFESNAPNLEGGSDRSHPGGDGLKTRLLETLFSQPHMSWENLVAELSGDFEDRLEDAISELESENKIRYNPRKGGYEALDS